MIPSLPLPLSASARVLPFRPPSRVVRRSTWPFPVARQKDVRVNAARILAITARQWFTDEEDGLV